MKKILLTLLGLTVVTIAVISGYLLVNSSPVSTDTDTKDFVINQGDSTTLIAQRLKKSGLIKDDKTFLVYAYWLGLNKKLQAGSFKLSPSMKLSELISKLSKGGSHDYWLKILPGQRVEEIAAKLSSSDPTLKASDFVAKAKDQEGYLYPDSYLVPQNYSIDQILQLAADNFAKKSVQASVDTTNKSMDQKQIVNLASILEREARTVESRRMVAGILLNRLQINMPLQVDASVQYAVDSLRYKKTGTDWSKYDFWQPISTNDLKIDSPFNTYINQGLPPSPICNPSYESIYAAYHPVESDYLFYITGNDNQMHYAKTLDEHNANIAKYLK